uniref:Uncharacterized protein n=1 Tax=Timema shepardi TaxID=629360 RepID=A0A7R9B559_TIMSH|nr:unnamed protein product [Timema shepardi]
MSAVTLRLDNGWRSSNPQLGEHAAVLGTGYVLQEEPFIHKEEWEQHAVCHVGDRAREVVGHVGDRAREVVGHVGDGAREVVGHVGDGAREVVGHVGDRAREGGGPRYIRLPHKLFREVYGYVYSRPFRESVSEIVSGVTLAMRAEILRTMSTIKEGNVKSLSGRPTAGDRTLVTLVCGQSFSGGRSVMRERLKWGSRYAGYPHLPQRYLQASTTTRIHRIHPEVSAVDPRGKMAELELARSRNATYGPVLTRYDLSTWGG